MIRLKLFGQGAHIQMQDNIGSTSHLSKYLNNPNYILHIVMHNIICVYTVQVEYEYVGILNILTDLFIFSKSATVKSEHLI